MISIRGLVKGFHVSDGHVTALKTLDLDVGEGEFFVIVGASGSGKTTLLRCVAGLESPEAGEIRIAGRVVSSNNPPAWVPPQRRHLGMVFQSYAVWPHLTVFQNVALPLTEGAQRVPRAEVSGRVKEALRLVQLDDLGDRSAALLSGGQQQRVALARAIAVNSKLLLMDEPLSNLDARLREDVRGRIRDLAKRLGSTVLYVTHDQVEAMAMADKIALLRHGELLQVGSPMDLYHRPQRAEVAEFFGQVNWLRGRVSDEMGRVETSIGHFQVASAEPCGGEVMIGFRPECLTPLSLADGDRSNAICGDLRGSTFLGDQFLYEFGVGAELLTGKSRMVPTAADGKIRVSLDPSDIMIFPAVNAPTTAATRTGAPAVTPTTH